MTTPAIDATAYLVQQLEAQIERYEQVLHAVTQLSPDGVLGALEHNWMTQIDQMMAQATAGERNVAAARQRWQCAGSVRTAALRDVVRRHERLLEHLIERIDQLQRAYTDARNALGPQIDRHNREGKVVEAYRRVLAST